MNSLSLLIILNKVDKNYLDYQFSNTLYHALSDKAVHLIFLMPNLIEFILDAM